MSIDSRLEKLEKEIGISDGETCNCASFSTDIRTYMDAEDNHAAADSDQRPPKICDRCGKPKDLIKVVVVYTREQVQAA